ncbi:3-oxoacyl-[acyl-carrier-protein] synthase III C-terminal domain-containing protein [Novosphingobium sp. MMS21-SN21R]|uniref:type III polyketide synthase n=1 Tax=Novosphingobium sp. MMS21-SN21R TaxID=2969298 RepID=UPI0028885723|nr:3-oxoacyl-[acyl-carrier-protein] synthase III C-terminal domain-containing protein [Novosphingobium sp. MMS21-SN21R]MDT0508675.1 3-oxoacyl-[acyl-carrier-protein] synthase III C-terminal domain-containing protein [Novosphingobium sp. MMS21-SN21R]
MTAPVTLLSLATATPPHVLTQDEALETGRHLLAGGFRDFDRMVSVFANAGIAERQLARPVEWYLSPRDFTERTAVYLEVALDLFMAVARDALAQAGLEASDVDTIVTVSSTGIATPSLDARAMAHMDFRSDVSRVPVFGLGCAGGVSGLALATRLARATPGSTVLFVTVELCSLAFRTEAVGKADVISVALFGDGAAACVVRSGDEGFAQLCGSAEKTWPDTLDIMGWEMEPNGFGVVLNRAIPAFARRNMQQAMDEMLGPQGLKIGDVDRFICHPGGAKVVDAMETAFGLNQGSLDHEREILRRHGNMSAPTALFVLDRMRDQGLPPLSVLTALGPGFTASTLTMRCAA